MSIDLRLPNITAGTEGGQLVQIKSYLYQLTEQLQWALNTIETGKTNESVVLNASTSAPSEEDVAKNFNALKSLIIKSADIVNAYYEKVEERLVGEYEALSDFGDFRQWTEGQFSKTSTDITQNYTSIQEITNTLGELEARLIDIGYIKTGVLGYVSTDGTESEDEPADGEGHAIYGLEIGQTSEDEVGSITYTRFARFTADRLSFYDRNGIQVAYVSNHKLFITNAEVTGTLKLGGYEIDMSDGLAFKWVGR